MDGAVADTGDDIVPGANRRTVLDSGLGGMLSVIADGFVAPRHIERRFHPERTTRGHLPCPASQQHAPADMGHFREDIGRLQRPPKRWLCPKAV